MLPFENTCQIPTESVIVIPEGSSRLVVVVTINIRLPLRSFNRKVFRKEVLGVAVEPSRFVFSVMLAKIQSYC